MDMDHVKINIKATDIELDNDLRSFIEKKITKFTKLLGRQGDEAFVYFEVANKMPGQHSGKIYRADCTVEVAGKNFYAESEQDDIKKAINDVKDKLFRLIRNGLQSESSLMRRGQATLKRMMRFGK